MPPTIWTIGHSTHPLCEFLDLLRAHKIGLLADVRTHPGSRRFPHFGKDALSESLAQAGIRYEHLPELGGRRKPRPDSRNTAWRNDSFRGYADYMETPQFAAGLERLLALAAELPTAIMCAESMWWSCHRALISDALKARAVTVLHIHDTSQPKEHPYTSAARIEAGRLTYQDPGALFGP